MCTRVSILPNTYRDSVALMRITAGVSSIPDVRQASIFMASEMNLDLARDAGLLKKQVAASPSDLLIAVEADSEEVLDQALQFVTEALSAKAGGESGPEKSAAPTSVAEAAERTEGLNLALISTPGDYAGSEAMKSLKEGLNVMIFSDNVPLDEEISLKRYALANDLLVMGPDCGTAVINGIPLAFANVLTPGGIGIAAASGTGLQEVTTLICDLGAGVSQAVGTGGRDLSDEVGGITMLQALEMLNDDPATSVILLVSKPPARSVAERILKRVAEVKKPVVINFLGAPGPGIEGILFADTLKDAAVLAAGLAKGEAPEATAAILSLPESVTRFSYAPGQRYLRGLYSGGTYSYEALVLLDGMPELYSNLHYGEARELENVWTSEKHTIIDMGEDVFTRGKPHPMIDYGFRNERIRREAADPQTAVILLDVVLGYGSHENPAGELAPVIRECREKALRDGRDIAFVGRVCATDRDPQNRTRQERELAEAGLVILPSNADAVRFARDLLPNKDVT